MNHKWKELLISIKQLLKSNRATKHQEIWKRTENGLELLLPKKIKTDIGFQLMFGHREDNKAYLEKILRHHNNYYCKTYLDIEDYKKYL